MSQMTFDCQMTITVDSDQVLYAKLEDIKVFEENPELENCPTISGTEWLQLTKDEQEKYVRYSFGVLSLTQENYYVENADLII